MKSLPLLIEIRAAFQGNPQRIKDTTDTALQRNPAWFSYLDPFSTLFRFFGLLRFRGFLLLLFLSMLKYGITRSVNNL